MKKSIKETVREAIEPTVNGLGYRLWDVLYSKIGADYHLEITIDSDDGINIDEFNKIFSADFDLEYKTALEKKKDYLDRDKNILRIKEQYLYVQNDVILQFMK